MAKWGAGMRKDVNNVQAVFTVTAAAASPRRARIASWTFGSNAALPADTMFDHIVQLCTTAGTGTNFVPVPFDQADPQISTIVCTHIVTADPTTTANAIICRKPLHQRNTFEHNFNPGYELVVPAVTTDGFMFGLSAVTTVTFSGDVTFEE